MADKAVQQTIQSLDFFQEEGRFIYSRYRDMLKNQKIPPADFEDRVRQEILTQNWRDLFLTALQSNALEEEKSKNPFQAKIRFAPLQKKFPADQEKQLISILKAEDNHQAARDFLKNLKLQWKTLSDFPPSHQQIFQFDNNELLMKAVLNYLPKTGFLPGLIPGRDKQYVVEVFKLSKKSPRG